MALRKKSKNKAEFGDFQTPIELAREVCSVLHQQGVSPMSILEPTCGKGSFIMAALERFPSVRNAVGIDINSDYIRIVRSSIEKSSQAVGPIQLVSKNFFDVDWGHTLESLPDPLLVIGNPPWITNAELGRIGSGNLPNKSNFQNHRGIDAITGKSNFDISEWMLSRLIEWITDRDATLAMLCKTTVARKVIHRAWKNVNQLGRSHIYHIEASKYFNAAVDTCLLVVSTTKSRGIFDCQVYGSLRDTSPSVTIGYRRNRLVANIAYFEHWNHLEGKQRYQWRSGVKHDCAKVMEFRREADGYRNGFGELVDLEDEYLYPMFKSSEISNGPVPQPSRWMLVPQQVMGESTRQIRQLAPKTWQYLQAHAQQLDNRASSIYRNRPRFAVFGVGDYSFAPWKIAISGFYKKLDFKVVGSCGKKSVVLDDTCYFIACKSEREASFICELLNSDIAKEFFSAFIFWDEKRPITVRLLKRLDLLNLARELGVEGTLQEFIDQYPRKHEQPLLFSESASNS